MVEKLTLHELAATAMQAIVAHGGCADDRREAIARQAYDMAQAMLDEAEQRKHKRGAEFE